MKIVTDTPAGLTLKQSNRTGWFIVGLILVAAGVFAVSWVKPQPLTPPETQVLRLLRQHTEDPQLEPGYQPPSTGGMGLDLAGYAAGLLFSGGRLFFLLGVTGLLVGVFIIISPVSHSQQVTFNASTGQVRLTRPSWFFRTRTESYPFKNIAEVRVERDRTFGPDDHHYRVCLVISHSEGAPLSPDYVFYKTVIPFSYRYRYSYQDCQTVVDRIQAVVNQPIQAAVGAG